MTSSLLVWRLQPTTAQLFENQSQAQLGDRVEIARCATPDLVRAPPWRCTGE